MNKTSWIVALSCFVTAPIGSFAVYALGSLLRSKPVNVSVWWQQNWQTLLGGSIMAFLLLCVIGWRMQKLGRW